jgi:transposase InsO family protein
MVTQNRKEILPNEEQKKYLDRFYGDPSKVGSLGGINRFYEAVKKDGKYNLSRDQIKNWLRSKDTYSLHKPIKRIFKRNRVIVGNINQQWDADIADMGLLKKANKNYRYFLLAIDVFSKFARTEPLKTKSAVEVTKAFKKMLPNRKGVPDRLHTDRGTEFTNKRFQDLLKEHRIKHFFTNNELKAMVSERCIKTIKLKLYQYFTESRKLNWIDHLEEVTDTYNRTKHRTIGMAPIDVTPSKTSEVWEKTYPDKTLTDPEAFQFKIGDKVRISFVKAPFERAYNYHWTGEIFSITQRFHKEGIAKYGLKDWNNEPIEGTFYTNELQRVDVDEDTAYKIEKILGRRVRNGQREVKVKWYLWPDKFNSWIPAANVQDFR